MPPPTAKQGVAQGPGFLAGKQGVVQTGNDTLPLGRCATGIRQLARRQVLRARGA